MSNLKAIVTSIIQKMNFWEQNAKKIDELTPMETVVDTAKIHVSDGGTSKSLLLSKLIQAATLSTENQIITIGEITLVDNDITIPNAQWKIAGVTYTKITPTVINIPFSATGKTRIDILVANTLNEIVKVIGFETTGVAVRPNIPLNTVLVTQIVVTDSALESVYSPLTTDELEAIHNSNAPSALNPFATMDDVGSGGGGGSQDLQSVTDVGNSTMNTINAFMYYAGVGTGLNTLISDETGQLITRGLLLIRDGSFETNSKSKPIYIGDSILGNPEFFLPDKVTGNYRIATTDDLESKADLVGGLVPSSQLPATVDEILEGTYINSTTFNDESSSPYTPSSNKYYLDLTTYKTYRWSGSVYTPMNEGLVLGETSSTAYRGDRGKTAYDHSQETGNPHGTTAAQVGAYSTTESDSALALKADKTIQETIISSGTTTLDFAFNSFGKTTQTGNIIIDGVNLTGTKKIEKSFLIQGSTNASHTITFPNNWTNLSGVSADSTKMNFIEIALINESVVYSINKYDIPDLIAPTLLKSSILLDALNTIELLYSEAIDSSVTTQTSWFNVVGKTVSSVTILSNKVRIVVSVPFTETDSTLVTFTNQVTGNGIQDASGNKVADFSQTIGVTTYRFDNFNRANSTTSINSPSDGGSDWVTPFGAVWGINSNKGYCFGANTTTATAHGVLLETNESNVILRKKVTYGTTGISSSAFFLRYTDNNNNYIVQFGKQNTGQLFYSVFKVVGGVLSILVNNTNFGTWVSGTEYTFMVKCSGNVITLYNGTTALTQITDNGLPTGTKHGLRIFAGSGSTGNTDRYDDFGVYYG